jgi:hypothetical protein
MKKDVFPGAKCRVISSQRGPAGSSVGRIVRAVSLHSYPHVVWGDMWDCEPLDGKPFEVVITSPDLQTTTVRTANFATVAADWLEVLEDDPEPPKVVEKTEELTE